MKTLARTIVRDHYDLFPPKSAKLTSIAYKKYVRKHAQKLLDESSFHQNGQDSDVIFSSNTTLLPDADLRYSLGPYQQPVTSRPGGLSHIILLW